MKKEMGTGRNAPAAAHPICRASRSFFQGNGDRWGTGLRPQLPRPPRQGGAPAPRRSDLPMVRESDAFDLYE